MKKKIIISILGTALFFLLIVSGCGKEQALDEAINAYSTYITADVTMKRDLLCLMMAYPDFIKGVKKGADGRSVFVVMKSGKYIIYDDGRQKSYDQKLANADLQDMLEPLYPLWDIDTLMEENYDPGRIRVYSLLKEVYGGSRQQITSNLESVRAGSKHCSFNRNNKASEALKQVFREISELARERPGIYPFVYPVNGTFNYRVISGTNQLSPHSFAIAIDLKSDKRDYWRWASREQGQQRLNSYPTDVVRIFEKNNFVWGGKWGHFDILHFEYRPELIIKARYYVEDHELLEPWYYGFPDDDQKVRDFIKVIEEGLG
ncbi:MAG: M15 family metallopeptidase [Bacillota bacterium]